MTSQIAKSTKLPDDFQKKNESPVHMDNVASQLPPRNIASTVQSSLMEWRNIYLISTLFLRFYFAVQTSYIHPDEHFQSLQPLYHDNLPWEFKNPNNINRSIVPLLIFYKPIINLGEWLNLSPLGTYFLVKLNITFWNWIIVDWCIYRIMPFKHEIMKSLFFIATSWITLSIQNHSFSNSIETIILLPTIYLINDIRKYMEMKNEKGRYSKFKLLVLGFLISLGLFNRITFFAWIFIPSLIFITKFALFNPISFLLCPISFIITSIFIISIDTSYFKHLDFILVLKMILIDINFKFLILKNINSITNWHIINDILSTTTFGSSFVIAPLNNLLYNLDESNLKLHGIHSRFLHLLVNYPLMSGPLLLLLPPFNLQYWKTTPFLAAISGISILSFIKHQELRFLIPMWPLVSSIISLNNTQCSPKLTRILLKLWIVYSLFLSTFYNMFHQSGIVPAMNELNSVIPLKNQIALNNSPPTIIFWKTYQPPTWMLNVQHCEHTHDGINKNLLTPIYMSRDDKNININSKGTGDINIIDLMGSPFSSLTSIIESNNINTSDIKSDIYLITPRNALLWLNKENISYEPYWETKWHLDMDHFEFDLFKWETFTPGLGIYKLI